jgi:hypothetical protein
MTDIDMLRSTLNSDQRDLLTAIWLHYVREGAWLSTRVLHSTLKGGKQIVRPLLEQLGGSVVYEKMENSTGTLQYAVTFLGVMVSSVGSRAEGLVTSYMHLARQLALREPTRNSVKSHEVSEHLGLTAEDLTFLGKVLITFGLPFTNGGSFSNGNQWEFVIPREIEDLPDDTRLYVRGVALREYDSATPLSINERTTYYAATTAKASYNVLEKEKAPMSFFEKLFIFLASPGNVPKERNHVEGVVNELNRTVAADKGFVLQVVRWEQDTYPGYGMDAQAIINSQIADMKKYALFVGIMWNRIGSSTPRAESGTVEEFERAVQAQKLCGQPEIWFYFRDAASSMNTNEELEQRRKVLAFRTRVSPDGLQWMYKRPPEFRDKFRSQMTLWLNRQTSHVPAVQVTEQGKPNLIQEVVNNDLGKGIKIGGSSNQGNLLVIAGGWDRFLDIGWVNSGWLYDTGGATSLAVAFFKVHVLDNGKGYAQIFGAANPPFNVWLSINSNQRFEDRVCWNDSPGIQTTKQWDFTWR